MAKVKIIAGKGESMIDAEEKLFKALNSHRNGEIHTENFTDPAMRHTVEIMEELHAKQYAQMMAEIEEVLDEEYALNYGNI